MLFYFPPHDGRVMSITSEIKHLITDEPDDGISKLHNAGKTAIDFLHRKQNELFLPKKPVENASEKSLLIWLHDKWANYGNFFKLQPIHEIRNYLGEKVAFYFAFVGFYTCWLVPFSILGLLVTIYGLLTYSSDTYVKESWELNYTLCPICETCNFSHTDDLWFIEL